MSHICIWNGFWTVLLRRQTPIGNLSAKLSLEAFKEGFVFLVAFGIELLLSFYFDGCYKQICKPGPYNDKHPEAQVHRSRNPSTGKLISSFILSLYLYMLIIVAVQLAITKYILSTKIFEMIAYP
jgi:hypothetical protein